MWNLRRHLHQAQTRVPADLFQSECGARIVQETRHDTLGLACGQGGEERRGEGTHGANHTLTQTTATTAERPGRIEQAFPKGPSAISDRIVDYPYGVAALHCTAPARKWWPCRLVGPPQIWIPRSFPTVWPD